MFQTFLSIALYSRAALFTTIRIQKTFGYVDYTVDLRNAVLFTVFSTDSTYA